MSTNVLLHDLGARLAPARAQDYAAVLDANGKYAPCQGCFGCWTKHPAECFMKDALHQACRVLGKADELTILTKNCYGAYSPDVKNVLDRSIGISTPMSTYRNRQMHHTLRYGKKGLLRVLVYGDSTKEEQVTFTLMANANAVNFGYTQVQIDFLPDLSGWEVAQP